MGFFYSNGDLDSNWTYGARRNIIEPNISLVIFHDDFTKAEEWPEPESTILGFAGYVVGEKV